MSTDDPCMMCAEQDLKCPECKCGCDLSQTTDLEDGDVVECMGCGEEWYVWLNQLIDADEYHENYCDSQAAAKYEEMAYGDDREDYAPTRSSSYYREDFHSDG